MRGKRGQAGIEYVILISLLLFFFIPLIHYSLQETTNAVKNSQLDSYINRLSKSIEAVHAVGPESVEVITITVPKGVIDANLVNTDEGYTNEVVLLVAFLGGVSDIHAPVRPLLYGEIPNESGTYRLKIKSLNETSINISIG